MTVPMRAMPVEDDAGALVLRYQQRIRAELLRKAADESSWTPRFRLGSKTHKSGGMPPLAERIVSVLQTFGDQRQFVTSGMVLSLVTAATGSALLLGSPGLLSAIGLMGLGVIVVLGVTRPVRWASLGLTGVGALGLMAAALLDSSTALVPGLVAALGLLATGLVADRNGLACRQEQEEREQTKRVIDDMQPVHEEAGVLKWPHASLVFDRELARAHRYGHPLTLLRVMVEEWDAVRASLGAEQAGLVLGEVGTLLVKSSRVVDIVAYHGDAKFDLLLPDTADLGAVVVARRVGAHNSQYAGVRLRVGVAPVTASEGSIDELIQQGDDAAMAASKLGRPFTVYGVEMKNTQALPKNPALGKNVPIRARR
jgi:diguanylate cyclase (GGDEF)-like protein